MLAVTMVVRRPWPLEVDLVAQVDPGEREAPEAVDAVRARFPSVTVTGMANPVRPTGLPDPTGSLAWTAARERYTGFRWAIHARLPSGSLRP